MGPSKPAAPKRERYSYQSGDVGVPDPLMLQTRIKNRLIRRGIVALALLATLPGAPVAAGQTFDEAVAAYEGYQADWCDFAR